MNGGAESFALGAAAKLCGIWFERANVLAAVGPKTHPRPQIAASHRACPKRMRERYEGIFPCWNG